jgi:hypothetical protein
VRVAAGIGIVVVAAILVVVLLGGGDDSPDDSSGEAASPASLPQATDGPVEASLEQLQELAGSTSDPIYWAGEQPGREYELTVERDGTIFVRYLDVGTAVGSAKGSLTVGTYPYSEAFETLEAAAKRPGVVTAEAPGGGLVVANESNPNNVYVAFPGSDFQIEVFDPADGEALDIATSGAVTPIE